MQITESTDDQLMVMAAHRYCLGRRTYIVGSCVRWLREHWSQFTRQTQSVMIRDTIEALMDNQAGDEWCDVPDWKSFAQWAWNQTDEDTRTWIRDAVRYKRKGEADDWVDG